MSKSVEKAANFYTAYLTSDDSSVLLSPAIQSAIDGQLQVLKKQISYKRYIVTEIIPNDRRPTRKQDQLITKPTKDFMGVKYSIILSQNIVEWLNRVISRKIET